MGLFVVSFRFVFAIMADADGELSNAFQGEDESNTQALRHILR